MRWAANPSTRLLPRVRGEEAQRRDGEVVVAVPEPGPAGVGEQVVPGRAPPTARAAARGVAQLGLARRRSARPGAGGPRAPTAPARPRPPPAVHGPCSISRRATAVRVRPSGWPASAPLPGPASAAPGPRRTGAGSRTGAGPLLFTTPVLPISRMIGKADPPVRGRRVSGLTVGPGRYPADMSRVGLGTPPPAPPAPQVGPPADGSSTIRRPGADPAPARAHRRADDGHRRARRRGRCPCRTRCSGCGCISLPARNATAADRDHLRRHGHAGAGLAVDRPHARAPAAPWPRPRTAPSSRAPGCCGRCRSRWRRRCSPRTSTATSRRARSPRAASTRTRSARPRRSGVDDPLTRTIPTIWRDTPAAVRPAVPHARARHHRADRLDDVVLRACTPTASSPSCGVALIIWALPRLARRCDLDAGLVALARRGEPAGAVPPGQRHPQRGPDDRADARRARARRCAPSTGARSSCATRGSCSARWWCRWLPRSSCRRCWRSGFVGMAAARQRGGRVRDVAVVAALLAAVAVAVFVVLGVGSGLGFGWTGTLGTANVIRSWMSLATDLGQLSRPDRDPRRARRPHRHRADDHPWARRPGRRAAVPAAAAARAARAAGPGHRAGRRAGRGRAARAGGAPLVPAVGGDPAGRHPRDAAAPARRAGGVGAARGHAAAHRRRLRVPVVPAAAGDPGRDRHPARRAARRAARAACGAAVRRSPPARRSGHRADPASRRSERPTPPVSRRRAGPPARPTSPGPPSRTGPRAPNH